MGQCQPGPDPLARSASEFNLQPRSLTAESTRKSGVDSRQQDRRAHKAHPFCFGWPQSRKMPGRKVLCHARVQIKCTRRSASN